jgi:hypothetical protein
MFSGFKISNTMKYKLLTLALLLISSPIYAQDNAKNKESKAEKAARIEKEYKATEKLIDSAAFVLTADFLSNQHGYRRIAEPLLNFIEVDSSQCIIQTGNSSGMGYNGVGGLTISGKINTWKVNKDPIHKTFMIRMSISSALGFYDVFMSVNASGKAMATLSGITRGQLIFEGSLCPLKESRTFEGRSL